MVFEAFLFCFEVDVMYTKSFLTLDAPGLHWTGIFCEGGFMILVSFI